MYFNRSSCSICFLRCLLIAVTLQCCNFLVEIHLPIAYTGHRFLRYFPACWLLHAGCLLCCCCLMSFSVSLLCLWWFPFSSFCLCLALTLPSLLFFSFSSIVFYLLAFASRLGLSDCWLSLLLLVTFCLTPLSFLNFNFSNLTRSRLFFFSYQPFLLFLVFSSSLPLCCTASCLLPPSRAMSSASRLIPSLKLTFILLCTWSILLASLSCYCPSVRDIYFLILFYRVISYRFYTIHVIFWCRCVFCSLSLLSLGYPLSIIDQV